MLKSYFEIIRFALSQKRKKGDDVYYESHHIVPKSLGKNMNETTLFGGVFKGKIKMYNGLKTDKKVTNGVISLVVVPELGKTIFIDQAIDKELYKKVYEIFAN